MSSPISCGLRGRRSVRNDRGWRRRGRRRRKRKRRQESEESVQTPSTRFVFFEDRFFFSARPSNDSLVLSVMLGRACYFVSQVWLVGCNGEVCSCGVATTQDVGGIGPMCLARGKQSECAYRLLVQSGMMHLIENGQSKALNLEILEIQGAPCLSFQLLWKAGLCLQPKNMAD